MLGRLDLFGLRINDAGCRVIAESLRTNRRLRRLDIENDEITGQGYASFIPVVCDASDIESTLNSNHTLEYVTGRFGLYSLVPTELSELLGMNNKGTDRRTVTKLKVLRCHFKDDFDLTAVAGLDAKILPHLLAWLGRLKSECSNFVEEQMCLSALYRITRHAPDLCGYPSYERVARLKAEDQVALLGHKLNVAESRIEKLQLANEAMERELEELRRNKRQKGAAFLE